MHKSSGKFQVSYACFQLSLEKGKERKGKLNQLIISIRIDMHYKARDASVVDRVD